MKCWFNLYFTNKGEIASPSEPTLLSQIWIQPSDETQWSFSCASWLLFATQMRPQYKCSMLHFVFCRHLYWPFPYRILFVQDGVLALAQPHHLFPIMLSGAKKIGFVYWGGHGHLHRMSAATGLYMWTCSFFLFSSSFVCCSILRQFRLY